MVTFTVPMKDLGRENNQLDEDVRRVAYFLQELKKSPEWRELKHLLIASDARTGEILNRITLVYKNKVVRVK